MTARRIDETDNEYGILTVKSFWGTTKRGDAIWKCSCRCGATTYAVGSDLRRGKLKSCGCEQGRRRYD